MALLIGALNMAGFTWVTQQMLLPPFPSQVAVPVQGAVPPEVEEGAGQ